MVKASFYRKNGMYCGFIVTGHAGGQYGQDIVCAGVSSAVMLTINTLTEFFLSDCSVRIEENVAALRLGSYNNDADGRALIYSLKTHLQLLSEDYGGITVITRNI